MYHRAWTGPLFRAIAFVVRERRASIPTRASGRTTTSWRAQGSRREATALFDDVSAIDYEKVAGPLRAALQSAGSAGRGALGGPARGGTPRALPARGGAGAGGSDGERVRPRARADPRGAAPSGALLAVFPLWPLAEGVRGAFVDGRGPLTFAYVATVVRNPTIAKGFATRSRSRWRAPCRQRPRHRRGAAAHRFHFRGRRLFARAGPAAADGPPLRRRRRHQAAASATPAP